MATALALLLAAAAPAAARKRGFLQRDYSACDCLNWQAVYERGLATCGMGRELAGPMYAANGTVPSDSVRLMQHEVYCSGFFMRLRENFCVNVLGSTDPLYMYRMWCYVSSECSSGMETIGKTQVKWKTCDLGLDSSLAEMEPEELHDWAYDNNLDMALAVKLAYPVERGAMWPEMKRLFMHQAGLGLYHTDEDLSKQKVDIVRRLMDNDDPFVLDSPSGYPPYVVMKGETGWLIESDPDNAIWREPNTYTNWTCIVGCDKLQAAPAAPTIAAQPALPAAVTAMAAMPAEEVTGARTAQADPATVAQAEQAAQADKTAQIMKAALENPGHLLMMRDGATLA
mmetsp:Transcript_65700/g.186476  ORF Transcript_65700/g.186476 Transcript_65700/m.186476 type:complete len:341 (-) Transcript_65700:194-1216(-)